MTNSATCYLDLLSYFRPWTVCSRISCSLCSQTSLHVSQPCKTAGSVLVLMYGAGSVWWYRLSDRTVPGDSSSYCDYNFMVNLVSVFVTNKICLFIMFTCYWRRNWMADFRFPGEYCCILNQYYVIMSLRHALPPVQQIPINPLALELEIFSLAHHLCTMWIFYDPRRVALGNTRHFVEE